MEIFDQFLSRFLYLAIFGNPNINYEGDWIATILEDAKTKLQEAGTKDDARQSCTLYAALEIEVLTSQVGYLDNLQNYIVGAKITPILKEWIFDSEAATSSAEQDFPMHVSLTFTQVLPKEIEAKDFVSFAMIKDTLFYPLQIKGGALANIAGSAVAMVAALSALTSF